MSALKSLPAVEQVGWYVRTARTMGDLAGVIVANSGSREADHYVFAPEHGNLVAALTAEAINTARETGIGPAEMRRQRDELLVALKFAIARLARVDGGDSISVSNAIDAIARTGEAFDVEAFIAEEVSKAEGTR